MKKLFYLFLVLSFSLGLSARNNPPSEADLKGVFNEIIRFKNEYGKLYEATVKIRGLYVDTVDIEKMQEDAIIGILQELDPHSVYIPKDEVKEMNEPLVGSFDGIGVQFQMIEDTLFVEQTIAGGPSEKVGILPGDRIIVVNDTAIAGVNMSTTKIMKRLRGEKGTQVMIKVLRRGTKELIEFKIIRDKIPLFSLDASYMVAPGVGYIKLNKFSATSKEEFDVALDQLLAKGMTDLIFDLQSNGGGYLQAAYKIADDFLNNKQLIVYTEGRTGRMNYMASDKGKFKEGRLILLVNEYAASASEILAGAVQDWDRGLIVGRRTFGKGLVQQPVGLSDGSIIRLTSARYYTPSGRCIQKPYDEGVDKYKRDVIERYNRGELSIEDSIHFPDSLVRETLLLKRPVYCGGGIMPDYFVPIDTSFTSPYLTKIIARGVVNEFASKYLEKNRDQMQVDYPSFDRYKKEFELSDTAMQELIDLAATEKIPFDSIDYAKSKQFVKTQLKALFARRLWDINSFYQVINQENEACKKAIEILTTPGMYEAKLKNRK